MNAARRYVQRALLTTLRRFGIQVTRLSEAERRYLDTLHQPGGPAPADADAVLRRDNPALLDLQRRYAALGGPAKALRWTTTSAGKHIDLRHFRGESLFVWHYRESEKVSRLKFHAYLQYLLKRDTPGLLGRLTEDGAFGCWTYAFPGLPTVSRDLLDAVNELLFLDRQLQVLSRPGLRVLDVGAGYGRLAHRFVAAAPQLADYCCVDAVPEATFLSRYYLAYRNATPPARIVPLDHLEQELAPGAFDLAVNIHSFPECTHAAIAGWIDRLARLRVPNLLIVPNDGAALLSSEPDRTRRPFDDVLSAAGYRRVHVEPVLDDEAVRGLIGVVDTFQLFRLEGTGG